MPIENFRFVRKGTGATMQIQNNQRPRIGTYRCNTCVGIYFQVDSQRCFFAHILDMSAVTYKRHYVTPESGELVRAQTRNRLQDFATNDVWNFRDDDFGKNLTIVCPTRADPYNFHKTTGYYVLKAIEDYLLHCAQSIEDQIRLWSDQQQSTPQCRQLVAKLTFLRHKAATIRPNMIHHGFVINPRNGHATFFGDLRRKRAGVEDCGHFRPDLTWPYFPARLSFIVGVKSDPGHSFPSSWRASNANTRVVINMLRRARAENSLDLATADQLANKVSWM